MDVGRFFTQAVDSVENLLEGGYEKYRLSLPAWVAGCQEESPKAKLVRRTTLLLSGLIVTMAMCSSAPGYYSSVGTKGLRTKPYASIGFAGVANGIQSHSFSQSLPAVPTTTVANAARATTVPADPLSANTAAAENSTVPSNNVSGNEFETPASLTIFQQLQNTMPFKNHLAFLLRTIGRGCQFAGTIALLVGIVAWVKARFDRRLGLSVLATAALAYGLPEVIRVLSLFSLGVNPFA